MTSVEEHPKGSGRYRVRARVGGKLRTVAGGLPWPEAEALAERHQAGGAVVSVDGLTLDLFGQGFLDRRELAGVRRIRSDRNLWKNHVAADALGSMRLADVRRRHVLEWRDGLGALAYRTKCSALNLLRVAFDEAVDRELMTTNVARDVKIHRSARASSKDGLEGVLTPDEQRSLVAAVPDRDRPVVVFALCTGLRQSEQWWLRWEDVQPGRVVVRRSAGGLPPKSGKPRTVPLLPAALAAIEELRARRSEWVFPAPSGGRRDGKPPRGWEKWLRAAGIGRHVRWHDLRHTCATSLLAGWWSPDGQRWTLDAVSKLLGHSSVQITERYARKLDSTLADAVAATAGPVFPARSQASNVSVGADSGIRTPDLCFTNASDLVAVPWEKAPERSQSGNTPAAWGLALAAERVFMVPVVRRWRKGARHA